MFEFFLNWIRALLALFFSQPRPSGPRVAPCGAETEGTAGQGVAYTAVAGTGEGDDEAPHVEPKNVANGGQVARDGRDGQKKSASSLLVVMRHGERRDEIDDNWRASAARPWDPPLSKKGLNQASRVADDLLGLGIETILCSPFTRCIQTAANIYKVLSASNPDVKWVVDPSFCEVLDPRVLKLADPSDLPSPAFTPGFNSDAVGSWWAQTPDWRGAVVAAGAGATGGKARPEVSGTDWPVTPETHARARTRMAKAISNAPRKHGAGGILVVTHGDCVAESVQARLSGAVVYEVLHCGYTLTKVRHETPERPQMLTLKSCAGEHGVSWMESELG